MKAAQVGAAAGIWFLAFCCVAVFTTGCSPDKPIPSTARLAYDAYRSAETRGDWEAVFPLMIPEVKDSITKTWSINKKTARLIETWVPAALKQNFLSEIGPVEVRQANSPAEYFGAVMRSMYPNTLLPGDSRYNVETSISRVERAGEGSRNYIITTAGGKKFKVNQGPDGLYGVDPGDYRTRIFRDNFRAAGDLLLNVKSVVDSLAQETGKAPR